MAGHGAPTYELFPAPSTFLFSKILAIIVDLRKIRTRIQASNWFGLIHGLRENLILQDLFISILSPLRCQIGMRFQRY